MYNGTATPYLARLNADGTLDATFHRGGAGMNGPIMSMALQQNGKILIGGYFTKYDNVNCNGLARLHPDGTLDGSFDTSKGIGAGAPNTIGVYAIVVQPDGRILVGGDFVEYDDAPRVGIARIWGD